MAVLPGEGIIGEADGDGDGRAARCKVGDAVTGFILGGSQREHERASKHLEFSLSQIAGTGMGDFGLRRVALLFDTGLL